MKITTAGESHGKGLCAILEGIPAGVGIDLAAIDRALARRQSGYGRGARQAIECDRVEILSGVRGGKTLGSPIALYLPNRDHETWKPYLAADVCDTETKKVTRVRPGHADLSGMIKFQTDDARNILERASARETAIRVAAGEICRAVLSLLGIEIRGFVRRIGCVADEKPYAFGEILPDPETQMLDADCILRAKAEIDRCRAAGDTLGGVVELRVKGLKCGFGSCMTYSEKLDARLAFSLFSVQAVKGVQVGLGFGAGALRGSEVHDEIFYDPERGYYRKTNRAGGIEGGMSNGEEIVLSAVMKPIPTLMRGLTTVDTATKLPATAAAERSDVCAVPAFCAVLESVLAGELCAVVLERLGGDTADDLVRRYGELQ